MRRIVPGEGQLRHQLTVRAITLFQRDFYSIPIDREIPHEDSKNLALHLIHALGWQVDAVVLQDEVQSGFGSRAAALTASPKEAVKKLAHQHTFP